MLDVTKTKNMGHLGTVPDGKQLNGVSHGDVVRHDLCVFKAATTATTKKRLISARLYPSGQNEELDRECKSREKVVGTCHM